MVDCHWWCHWKLVWGVIGHVVVGVSDGDVGGGVLKVVGSLGSALCSGIVGAYLFWSWLLHVASMPSVGARQQSGLVLSPQGKSVLDHTMARLILVEMKLAMSEYVRLHFFVSIHAMQRLAVSSSLEVMPSTE